MERREQSAFEQRTARGDGTLVVPSLFFLLALTSDAGGALIDRRASVEPQRHGGTEEFPFPQIAQMGTDGSESLLRGE